jgi:predicted molibdopterin-dependent oxidoreductase YjgC
MGLKWNYAHPSEVYTEMASLMPSLDNISWDRISRESAVIYPSACRKVVPFVCTGLNPSRSR